MAKIRTGALVAEIRNKLGDVVYTRNKYGAFSRLRVDPENAATPARTASRDRLTAAVLAWNDDLSDAQRNAWAAYALALSKKSGPVDGKAQTARSAFLTSYMNLDNIGVATLTDPPDQPLTGQVTNLSLTVDADTQTLELDGSVPAGTASQGLVILATPPLTPARYNCWSFARQITALAPGWAFPLDLWDEYTQLLDTPGQGYAVTVWVHAIAELSGLSAPRQSVRALATGDAAPMLYKTVVLTDAQIKALPTTPVDIVPFVAGRMIIPLTSVLQLNATAGAYANISAGPANYLATACGFDKSNRLQNNVLFTGANLRFTILPQASQLDAIPPTQIRIYVTAEAPTSQLTLPLRLYCINALGAFTGGNAANTLTVTTYYQLLLPA